MASLTFEQAITQLRVEDTTYYCKVLQHFEDEKLDSWDISVYLKSLEESDVAKFTPIQLSMLNSMMYKNGYSIHLNYISSSGNTPPISTKISKLKITQVPTYDLDCITKEDLKYLSTYHKNQWRKLNPTNKYTKGTQLNFTMDEFSLTIFRNSVTKAVARTEAKNYIIKINKGFDTSAKDQHAIKIRNKFYYTVLINTANHTKTLLNTLRFTSLTLVDGKYYMPDADEALRVDLGWGHSELVAISTAYSRDTYSTDLALVTHSKFVDNDNIRDQFRTIAAASILLTLHEKTGAESYFTLANETLKPVSTKVKEDVIQMTNAINSLRSIITLKEDTNE